MPVLSTSAATTLGSGHRSQMHLLQILLIDDDALIVTVLKSLLESLGHAVICADNAPDAELAFSVYGRVELLLSDYNLPGTTGLVLAKRFTERRPELRVILMSGEDLKQEILNDIRSQGWSFLSKPMRHSDLVGALRHSS